MALSSSLREYGRINREIAAIIVVAVLVALVHSLPTNAADSACSLRCGPYAVELNANGAVTRIAKQGSAPITVADTADNAGVLVYGKTALALEKPAEIKSSGAGCTLAYQLATTPATNVHLSISLHQGKGGSLVVGRELAVQSAAKLAADLTVKLPLWPSLGPDTWLPLFNATAGKLGDKAACAYKFAGALPTDGVRLSIPMVSSSVGGGSVAQRVTVATDPYFSSLFTRKSVAWTYPKGVGLEDPVEKRTVVTVFHAGAAEDAVQAFFAEALPDVPPGPKWLHEIAMVDYDYMSDAGKGWFADIDALTKALPREDRAKVFLCLHGWYDWVGRHCFDAKKGKFDDQWTAFGNYEKAKKRPSQMTLDGDTIDIGFAKCVPVQLSLAKVHERLAYAKSRGFRVGLYFAGGTIGGTDLPTFSPRRVLRNQYGWAGPDVKGDAVVENPLVSEVYRYYLAYADALLAEFGHEVDAFVWDETFQVPAGSLGSAEVPGYADRAMMRLVRAVAKKIEDYNRRNRGEIALLASDDLGPVGGASPDALVAHGTYQDSWCDPKAWSYGIFPNYRNAMWSCCWWPVHKWKWVELGVREYQAPVSLSNGYGDNIGFSEMSPEMQQKVLALFQWRKQRPTHLKFLERVPAY
jgi:hypothetical protein